MDSFGRGWKRVGRPGRFKYLDGHGKPITDPARLERIRALRIPPAWTDVRIAPRPTSKLQAVGFDKKGRKQYLYHPDWVSRQAQAKYAKLVTFVRGLPGFRETTSAHLAQDGLGRERVLALVTRLINEGCFRIGGERYAKENKSFGIATLHARHLTVTETHLRFQFRGKRGVMHSKVLPDPDLLDLMRALRAVRGSRLFKYQREDGAWVTVTGKEVNAYIKQVMGAAFSAKDFRTWGGTMMAARILAAYGPAETATARKKHIRSTVRAVARYLGNTPAIARASYISPIVFQCYEQGVTLQHFAPRKRQLIKLAQAGYTEEEIELMRMLSIAPDQIPQPAVTITLVPEAPARATAS